MCNEGHKIKKSELFPNEYSEEIEVDLNAYLEKGIEKLKQQNKQLKIAVGFL